MGGVRETVGERPVRTAVRDRSALDDELGVLGAPLELRATGAATTSGHALRRLPPGVLLGATLAWLGLVFGLCYVAIPAGLAVLGVNGSLLGSAPVAAVSFGATSLATAVGAAIARPGIRLGLRAARDPVVSATAGGLLTWAVIHNTSWALRPFWEMGPTELGSFVSANVLEMFLIGALLASFTRSRALAFALGAGFQLVAMRIFVFLVTLLS